MINQAKDIYSTYRDRQLPLLSDRLLSLIRCDYCACSVLLYSDCGIFAQWTKDYSISFDRR